MLSYEKKHLRNAWCLLSALREDLENVSLSVELQEHCIGRIKEAEAKVRFHKGQAKNMPSRKDASMKKVELYQYYIFIYKCFGDAIAFLNYDRFSLKQFYFDVDGPNPKQSGGFISGKKGFNLEWTSLVTLSERNIGSLLCDITNIIRFGDICVLGLEEPAVIEIKTSKTKDRRGARQRQKLKKLAEFMDTDVSDQLRGGARTERREAPSTIPPVGEVFDKTADEAREKGFAFTQASKGIFLACIYENGLLERLNEIPVEKPLVSDLNRLKNAKDWAPMYPFTLQFRSFDNLWDFIIGKIILVSFVDFAAIQEAFAMYGYRAEYRPDEAMPLDLYYGPATQPTQVGHIFQRLFYELLPIEWLVQTTTHIIQFSKE